MTQESDERIADARFAWHGIRPAGAGIRTRALIAGIAWLFSSIASGQATVQLYGVADGNVRLDHTTVGTLKGIGSGGGAGTRWGLKGTEDIGNGLKANFVFEQGFDLSDNSVAHGNVTGVTPTSPTSSTGSRFFSRVSTVGLASDAWGNLRVGRDYKSIARLYVLTDAFGGGYVGSVGNIAPRFVLRYDNAILYDSPTVSGVRLSLQYGFGESTTDATPGTPRAAGNRFGGGIFYTKDRLSGGIAYSSEKAGVTSASLSNGVNRNRITEAALTCDLDVVKLHAFAWSVKDDIGYRVRSGSLAISVPFGAWTFAAAYGHLNDLGASNAAAPTVRTDYDADFYSTLATYSLSKRSTLYASAAAFRNRSKAGSYFIVDGNTPGLGLYTGANIVHVNPWSAQLGVTHTF